MGSQKEMNFELSNPFFFDFLCMIYFAKMYLNLKLPPVLTLDESPSLTGFKFCF